LERSAELIGLKLVSLGWEGICGCDRLWPGSVFAVLEAPEEGFELPGGSIGSKPPGWSCGLDVPAD